MTTVQKQKPVSLKLVDFAFARQYWPIPVHHVVAGTPKNLTTL